MGRGSRISSSYSARASAAGVEGIGAEGGDGGRDGGSLIVNLPAGGVVGGLAEADTRLALETAGFKCGDVGGDTGWKGRLDNATRPRHNA